MSSNLERRVLDFLAAVPGSESLDDLFAGPEFAGERRADFLLFDRRLIVELKSIEVDTSPKVESEMDRHRNRDDFPLIYGEVELNKILKHLPDGGKINDRIFMRTTRSIEDATRSAEDQIENTAKLLGISDAVGIMVMINQDIDILTPEVIATRISMLMKRAREDGSLRSPIIFSWLIFESHTLTLGLAEKTLPMILLAGPRASEFPWVTGFLDYLQVAWAQFNGYPLFKLDAQRVVDIPVAPLAASKQHKPGDKISRQQLWERNYHNNPYLRALSDREVLQRGHSAIEALLPHFMVGEPKLSLEEMEPLMIVWSDFLCETRHRGLDLREMPRPNLPSQSTVQSGG